MRRSTIAAVLESTFVSIGLALAVSYRFFEPIWDVGANFLTLGALTALAYIAGFVVQRRSERSWGFFRVVLVTIVVSQPVLLTMWLLGGPLSRIVLVFELVLLFLGLAFAATRLPASLRVGVAVAFAGVAAYPTLIGGLAVDEAKSLPATEGQYMFSGYHDVNVTEYSILEDEQQRGGAMTLLPDGRVLLVAGSGAARILTLSGGLESSEVDLRLPMDVDEYRARASNPTPFYRVTDILYSDERLLVSYTGWDPEADCYTLRLVDAGFDGEATTGPWTTRFESQPCVELSSLNNQTGGALAVLDSLHVLLTIGAFGKHWSEDADYGTIVKLNTATWRPEVFSRGHRNPQGLVVSEAGIWSTEHGPDGGDELNTIEAGRHYGWPLVSYGTDYGKKTLASGRTPGDHSGFEEPVLAWLPSVGISSLIRLTGDGFPLWKGDLLIGSLSGLGNGRTIFRVRLVEGNAVSVEQIPTGMLIRDLLELPDGSLIIWSGRESVQVVRPADHVFSQCSACHGVHREAHGIGPDLQGVVGRAVAPHSDYEYSPAMKAYGGRWTKARLDRFLESPSDEIPGTKMEFDGIEDPAERAAIITFLEDTRNPSP